MTYTINPSDPQGLLCVLGEASIELDNENAPKSKALIDELRDQLRAQLKPAIKEPLAFASVVRAKNGTLYVRLGALQALPWGSGEAMRSWEQLEAVEVLRVGLETAPSKDDGDVLPEATEDYAAGVSDTIDKIHQRLQYMLDSAITSERKNALEKAIQAVEELAP